jgi:ribosomal subunit interface protein
MTDSLQVPLQITIRDMPRSEALDADIRGRVAKLEEFSPRIVSCRVNVEQVGRHQHQGKQFRVRIDVRVPGEEIVVNRDHDEDVYVALRDAFDAAKRQLEDVVREKRGDVKVHGVPLHGKVTRLHPVFDELQPGTQVQFIEELAAEGPQAKRVSVGKHHF